MCTWYHALIQSRMRSVSRSVVNLTWLLQQSTNYKLNEVIQGSCIDIIYFMSGLFHFINNHAALCVGYKKMKDYYGWVV
jgi:hypothetical protein